MKLGITINRPPRDGQMAFVRSPDLHSIELLQKGDAKPPAEPWTSMPNTGQLVSLVQILRGSRFSITAATSVARRTLIGLFSGLLAGT